MGFLLGRILMLQSKRILDIFAIFWITPSTRLRNLQSKKSFFKRGIDALIRKNLVFSFLYANKERGEKTENLEIYLIKQIYSSMFVRFLRKIGSFSIDDGNGKDDATNKEFDWSSEEK